jgi:plasmid maintenance system antidote protein VapI
MQSDIDKINNRIKIMGIKKGYVAKRVDTSKEHLSYVLNGHRELSDELKTRLFSYLGIA